MAYDWKGENEMNIKEKLGILYAAQHCCGRSCDNCAANEVCRFEKSKEELFTSLRNDINNLIKERDEAVAALKEKSEN